MTSPAAPTIRNGTSLFIRRVDPSSKEGMMACLECNPINQGYSLTRFFAFNPSVALRVSNTSGALRMIS
jgi:hypothetical protein